MPKYLLAHDLGTSGNKATLFDTEGRLIKSSVYAYELITGPDTAAEQRADDWWRAVCETTKKLTEEIDVRDIAAVSFSGQMMGCLCVDRDGVPLHNALIWADMRSMPQSRQIRERIDEGRYYSITGHRISASDSITKLMWIRDNLPDVYRRTYRMLNAKDYVIFKLTGRFVTEPSDASSTCMLDLASLTWSDEIISAARLDKDKLPEIISSVDIAGGVTAQAARQTGLLEGTPVVCGGGDGCCAAVGTGVVKEGIANCCLGTSSWISVASREMTRDEKLTVFNFAHIVPGYIMPTGTMQTGGGSLSWAVKELYKGIDGQALSDKNTVYASVGREVEASPLGARGLLFLPYLIGERAPRWNDKAKGAFIGLTLNHTRGDMLRAVMEGVGYNLEIILNTFRKSGNDIGELIMVGGGARNLIWQKILCDILGVPVNVPDTLEEATSMGAAITAGVGVGIFDGFDAASGFIKTARRNVPDPENNAAYGKYKELFDEAYYSLEKIFEKL